FVRIGDAAERQQQRRAEGGKPRFRFEDDRQAVGEGVDVRSVVAGDRVGDRGVGASTLGAADGTRFGCVRLRMMERHGAKYTAHVGVLGSHVRSGVRTSMRAPHSGRIWRSLTTLGAGTASTAATCAATSTGRTKRSGRYSRSSCATTRSCIGVAVRPG